MAISDLQPRPRSLLGLRRQTLRGESGNRDAVAPPSGRQRHDNIARCPPVKAALVRHQADRAAEDQRIIAKV